MNRTVIIASQVAQVRNSLIYNLSTCIKNALNSAQSPIGRNIAAIRHRYTICVLDIYVNHVHRQCPFSQIQLSGTAWCILELLCVSNNEIYLHRLTKTDVNTMINTLCTDTRFTFIDTSVFNCIYIIAYE